MFQDGLILDRYEPIGTAGEGGFGTVQIAWDPRIQRKVAVKTIKLTAQDAYRAALPGAQAVSAQSTADRWHGAVPWNEFLAEEGEPEDGDPLLGSDRELGFDGQYDPDEYAWDGEEDGSTQPEHVSQVTSLAHLPGLDEARTAAMLADPRIVTVYDFEVRGRYAYLIMEYIEGITLTQLMYDYPDLITLDMVAAVFDSVAGALEMAHGAGVLHLDIKPDNILINPQGQVKVTDFGLATLADASGLGTTGGGTIGYMPLEQMRREHLDARTDEWSLAAVAYEMLSGDNPFRARDLAGAEAAIEEAELVLPSLCWQNLDEQIDDVVFYALDPDREERYDTIADFAEEMDKFLGDADEGREQLAMVVSDALGYFDEDDVEDIEEEGEVAPPSASSRLLGVVDRIVDFVSHPRRDYSDEWEDGEGAYYEDADDPGYQEEQQVVRKSRSSGPLVQRVPKRVIDVAARAFGAGASGFLAFFAFSNMRALQMGLGSMAPQVLGVLTLVIAAIGAFSPHVGGLVSFCLLAIAVVLCGHPLAGAIVLVVSVAWWYMVGHHGKASANAVLSQPLAGSIGSASIAPFAAGASMEIMPAIVSALHISFMAVLFAAFGSKSLFGWDAFAHWSIGNVDVTKNVLDIIARPSTWVVIFSWVASAGLLSVLASRKSRAATAIGIVLAAALVIAGPLAFFPPSPQVLAPPIVAALVLLILLV